MSRQLKKIAISPIALLMMVSELLIALFVWQWLKSEYNGQKMELHKDLSDQFMAAKSRVMDSVISRKFITPLLNDPNGFKIRSTDQKGFHRDHDSIRVIEINSDFSVLNHDSLNLHWKPAEDSSLPQEKTFQIKIENDTADKFLYHGVKMFIARVAGPHGENDYFERNLESGDTALLKTYFTQNLHQDHLGVKAVWVNHEPHEKIPPPLFYYDSEFLDHPFGVRIEQVQHYLFLKIMPQILFALLLLVITSAAFVFSFRSLRAQLRLVALKDDFISNMSHELKTPVATIKVAIEAMQQMDPVQKKETVKEYLGIASQELTRLDLLINKVMSSILLDRRKPVFRFELVNFNRLIGQTIKSVEPQLAPRQAKISFESTADNITAPADAILVQGIFYNLIENSLKYGQDEPEISLQLSESASEVIVEVSDNGPGIPKEYLDKVFEKFLRIPTGNKHNVKGFGLGLNYVQQVMEQHLGKVTVKNNEGSGCTFQLRFPKDSGR